MNKERARQLLDEKLADVADSSAAVAEDFSETAIHAFRVAVKKLRAYVQLIESGKDQPKMSLGKKVKRLYDIAGEIRSAQLEEKKVKGQKKALPGYSKNLSVKILLNRQLWNEQYKPGTFEKLSKRLAAKPVRKISAGTLVCFLRACTRVLEDIADSSPDDEMIHTARKRVKEMLYNTKLAGKHWPKAHARIAHLPLSTLDKLSELLGDYNDERLIQESLLSFSPKATNADEKKALKALSNKVKALKEQHRQALINELKRFVTAAAL